MKSLLLSLIAEHGNVNKQQNQKARSIAQNSLSDLHSIPAHLLNRRTSDPTTISTDPTKICLTIQQYVLNTCSDPQALVESISCLPVEQTAEKFKIIGKRLQTVGKLVATFVSLTAATTFKDLEFTLFEKLRELLQVERVILFFYNPETKMLTGRDKTGLVLKADHTKGITGFCARTKLSVLFKNARGSNHFCEDIDETVVTKTKNIMCIPILNSEGNVDGVLQVCNKIEDKGFSENDEFLVVVISSLLRILMQNLSQREKLRKKVTQCDDLLHISKSITAELDTRKVVDSILVSARQLVRAERSSFFQVDYETATLTTTIDSKKFQIPLQSGVVGRAVTTARSINVTNTAEYPFWDSSVDKKTGYHTKSMLTVPILSNRNARVIGVIQMINKIDEDNFSTDDLEILESFGHFASISLNNSQAFNNSLIKERNATQMLSTFKQLSSPLKLDDLLSSITEQARSLLGADRGTVFLVDRQKQELWSTVIEGMDPIRIPFGKGIAGHVAETGEIVNIANVYTDSRFYSNVDQKSGYKTNSILCVPIFNSVNVVIGVTQMINKTTGDRFTHDDEKLASAFAKDASVFIEKSKIYEEAKANERIASAEAKLSHERYMDLETKVLMKVISDRARILSESTSCVLFLRNATDTAFEAIDNTEEDLDRNFVDFMPKKSQHIVKENKSHVLYYPITSDTDETIGILKLVKDSPFKSNISEVLQEITATASDILRNTFYSEKLLSEVERFQFLSLVHSKAIKTSQLFQQTMKMHHYLQAVLSTIDQLVFTINSSGKFVQSNHQLERFGFATDVITTLPVTEWANHSHPNNEIFFKQLIDCHTTLEPVYNSIFEFYESEKSSKFIRYSIVPLLATKDQGTVIIIEDITQNKKLNQSLEIFQTSALGLISSSFNPSIQIQSLLRMMLQLLSGRQIFLFSGETKHTMKLLHQISNSPTSESGEDYIFSFDNTVIEQAFETRNLIFVSGSSVSKKQVSKPTILCSPLLTADHVCGVVYLEGTSFPRKLSSSEKRIFLVFSSVLTCYLKIKNKVDNAIEQARVETEGARSAQEIIDLKQRALESERAKALFLMNMSHELRTPLNAVIGTAELLRITKLNNQQSQFLDTIYSSSNALLSIINDILDASKADANEIVLDIKPFDLRVLLEDEICNLADMFQDKNIEITLDMNPAEVTSLQGDSSRLRQIFSNLIGNACKFSHPNSQVSIVVTRVSSPTSLENLVNSFHFRVIDSGIGISAAAQEHLFKPFTQVDTSTTRQFGGSGLGLVICKHLVQLMKGDMFVQSSLGRGTQVSFCCAFPTAKSGLSSPVTSFRKKTKVLVISSLASKKILLSILEHLNCKTFSYSTIEECSEFLVSRTFKRISFVIADNHLLNNVFISLASSKNEQLQFISLSKKMESVDSKFKKIFIPLRLKHVFNCLMGVNSKSCSTPKVNNCKSQNNYKALVVEDNTLNQRVLKKQLERIGLFPDVAENGKIAVEMFEQNVRNGQPYDIVFMDCHMPVMDGYEATQNIRQIENQSKNLPSTPIIALTADALTGTKDACFASGMDDYYTKPLKHQNFLEIYDKYLSE